MPRSRSRPTATPVDLSRTLEALATRIGDTIGRSIAEALAHAPLPAAAVERAPSARRCGEPGCGKPAAAKGLCKSHYNLMLYHRRKAAAGKGAAPKRRAAPKAKAAPKPRAKPGRKPKR